VQAFLFLRQTNTYLIITLGNKKHFFSAALTFVVNLDVTQVTITRDVVFLFKLTLLLTINPTIQNYKIFNNLSCLAHYFDC
jgi:hypothetical protein